MYMVCPSICKATDVRMKSEKPEKKSKQPLMIFLKGIGHFLTDGEVWGGLPCGLLQ